MHPLLTSLLDLVFPPQCPCCRQILAHGQALACPRCYASLPWLPEEDAAPQEENTIPCVAAGWYQGDLREIMHAYKFEGQHRLASPLALPLAQQVRRHYGEAFDLITWVPVSHKTLKTRGYDQSRLLAEALAADLGRTALPLLRKQRHTPAQSSLTSPSDRRSNVAGAFVPVDSPTIAGRRILLVDDVITTGSTLEEIIHILYQAGALRVMCATLCRTPPVSPSAPKPR
jgi:ComF family protein